MMRKLFCIRNHEIKIIGRDKYGLCIACKRQNQIKYERKNPQRKRDFQWKSRGINCTENLYTQLLISQNYRCAICEKHQDELTRDLSVDHNHKTGTIRGLLCKYCNQVVVSLVENKQHLIKKASDYLENEYVH